MNAQEMILNYAAKHNDSETFTDQQLAGKMITEGVVISRGPNKVVAKIQRIGKEIIVTETTHSQTHEVVNGKIVDTDHESIVEIFRVSI